MSRSFYLPRHSYLLDATSSHDFHSYKSPLAIHLVPYIYYELSFVPNKVVTFHLQGRRSTCYISPFQKGRRL